MLQEATFERLTAAMERPETAVMKNLSGYILPQDTLIEIRALLMKRYQNPFSAGLSAEARMAMQQMAEEVKQVPKESIQEATTQPKQPETTRQDKSAKSQRRGKQEHQRTRISSFTETFAKTSPERLDGDITDENYSAENQKKKAIGGKLESAMETIEIVKHGEPEETVDADVVKRNSVEKCLVWMEVNGETDSTPTAKVGRYNTAI